MQHSGDNWQVAILSFYLLDLRDAAQVNVLGTRGLFPLIQFCGTKHELFKANLKKKIISRPWKPSLMQIQSFFPSRT